MGHDKTTPRVLIVDDEETIRVVAGKALRTHGYICEYAQNGIEALQKVRKKRFDLVVTDLKMPVLDGLAMIEALRHRRSELPIVVMTGYGELDSARRAIRLGVGDYLTKPFDDLNELVVAAERAIAARKKRAESEMRVVELEERSESLARESASLRDELTGTTRVLRRTLAEIANADSIADEHVVQVASLIAGESDGVMITDTSGRVVAANPELLKYLNAPSWKGTGAPLWRMPGDSELREAMEELARSAVAGIEAEARTVEGVDADGENVVYELSSVPVHDEEGAMIGACVRVKRCTCTEPTVGR